MTGLSRCGRVYRTFDEAYRAAEARSFKTKSALKVASCAFGEHWHVLPANQVIGLTKPPRLDPFPPIVAKLIDARDEGLCQRCGRETRLERHHRRAKGSGGSKSRSHTQCPCNSLSLCRRCHAWTHANPSMARLEGTIVRQAVNRPGAVGVLRYLLAGDWAADVFWATCDGRWVHGPKETED